MTLALISTILAVIGAACALINAFIAPKVEEEKYDKAVARYFKNLAEKKKKKD